MLEDITFDNAEQLFLFSEEEEDSKNKRLAKCIDNIESRFGKNVIKTGYTRSNGPVYD